MSSKMVIRLLNKGKTNHPLWWIVIQPHNKSPKKYKEKLGIVYPRKLATVDRSIVINRPRIVYWLGVILLIA
jgi:ribosomal protein S16